MPSTSMTRFCWLLIIVPPPFGVVKEVVVLDRLVELLVPLYLLISEELTECMSMCS